MEKEKDGVGGGVWEREDMKASSPPAVRARASSPPRPSPWALPLGEGRSSTPAAAQPERED